MSHFHIVLPSNNPRPSGNRTSAFTVRLAQKLEFNSDWRVGLAVAAYPHSWATLGTNDQQWLIVNWVQPSMEEAPMQSILLLPRARPRSVQELERYLQHFIEKGDWEARMDYFRGIYNRKQRVIAK